jgi:tungstate transport system ATP-binding protein
VKPILSAMDLSLKRSGREVFRTERFDLYRGEVLALIGPNGAGKTSLLLTLALLHTPSSGSIRFAGTLANRRNTLAFRRRMAVVFQEALLLDVSVLQNLLIPLRMRGVAPDVAGERAARWLERFGIAHLAHQRARSLSGGEAQRTSLARALALEPDVLFLDEPFASLDTPTRRELLAEMGGILRSMRATALFVTHDYTEIPYLAERVAVMRDGRVTRCGSLEEIFGAGLRPGTLWAPWEDFPER